MRVKTSIKVGVNSYKEITQKQARQILGDAEFNNLKAEFISLVENANDFSYLDFKAFKDGAIIYFERTKT